MEREMAASGEFFGRMNDPVGSAFLKGPCGDEIEFYLDIENGKITDLKFYTEGCETTKECGAVTAALAKGRKVEEALEISPAEVMRHIRNLPEDHLHCSILSVSTLHRAIADYMLKKGM
ncbi:MAG: iron-sulfur cluster assembly scaffold protein [Endomicrobiales bacterium]|nr:iron-sulfur cluster assembly scaffold protein [Endomicrobiales bacterium]